MGKKYFWNGEWESVELIGKGTYGSVYKVKKTNTEIEAISAIKEIHLPNTIDEILSLRTEGLSKEDIDRELLDELNSLKREIKTLYQFKDSINVINIEDYKVEELESNNEYYSKEYVIYIRMELLESINSLLLLDNLKDKEVLKLGIDIASALDELEEEKFIHRDIKPENIFVNKNGVYKLGDFGEAKQLSKTMSNTSIRGTEQYMAPELLSTQKIDKTVDIYSLGLVLYRFFNNKKFPFYPQGSSKATFKEREEARYKRYSGEKLPKPVNASDEVADIILKMCAYKKEDRYQNASELKSDLEIALRNIKRAKNIFTLDNENNNSDDEEDDEYNKTVSLYARRKKAKQVEEPENEYDDEYNKTISLYKNIKRRNIKKDDKNINHEYELNVEQNDTNDESTLNKNINENISINNSNNDNLESNLNNFQNDYDYIVFANNQIINKYSVMEVKISDRKKLLIPLKNTYKDRDIFKIKQDGIVKNVLYIDKPNLTLSQVMNMNSNLKERSITISCEEGIKGCTKVIDYKGTKINYSIPPFKERKKVFLVEQDNLMFKLLVEKADGRYKAASGIKCFLLIIFFSALMGETLNILMSIILTFLIGYPISTFILDRITGNNRW